MTIITTVKRRYIGKGCQTFKRVGLTCIFVLFIFHFFKSSPPDRSKTSEDNFIVPGEALDPIIKKVNRQPAPKPFNEPKPFDEPKHETVKKSVDEPKKKLFSGAEEKFDFHSKREIPENPKKIKFQPKKSGVEKIQNDRAGIPSRNGPGMVFDDSDVPSRMETAWSMAKANIPDMEKVRFKEHAITNDTITLTLMSSADKVFMSINKKQIYKGIGQRGFHVVVLNQFNGRVMAKRVFDTFQNGVEEDMVEFLDEITPKRIVIFAVLDEVATGLTWKGRNKLKEMGSRFSQKLAYRDMWAMVTRKDGLKIAETFSNVATADTGYEWGGPIFMRTDFDLEEKPVECQWPYNERNQARRLFCVRYEGYGRLCRCDVTQWEDIFFEVDKEVDNKLRSSPLFKSIGVVILATNRSHSLFKTLKSLHEAPGFNKDLLAIYVESPTREVASLAKLFGVRVVETKLFPNASVPLKIRYKMQRVFRELAGASFEGKSVPEGVLPNDIIPPFVVKNLVVLEEDISVSIDFFKYLHSVHPILDEDDVVLAISAFNYHGYRDVVLSQTNSYRTSDTQSLAILIPEKTLHNYIVPYWPPSNDTESEWFVGLEKAMKNGKKDIVYPEIPRAKHTSYEGFLIQGQVQNDLFKEHMISLTTDYKIGRNEIDRLKLENYKSNVSETIRQSKQLTFDFCEHDLAYGLNPFVMYVSYDGKNATDLNYVFKCLKTWSEFPIGGWRDVWQFHYHGHLLSIVGVPASPFSSLKPKDYKLITAPPKANDKKEKH